MFGLNIIETSSVGSAGLSATRLGQVRASINAAAEMWGRYIDAPDAVIDVELNFANLGFSLATAGAFYTGGGGVSQSVVIQELAGNRDISSGVRDATLNIDISDLRDPDYYFYDTSFEPNPAGLASNQYDFLSVMIHEFGHILGLTVASNFTTPFGALTQVIDGVNYFVGSNAVAANGGNPVALTGSHLVSEDLLDPSTRNGERGLITPLHIAIWEDIGIPIAAPTTGADTLFGFELVDDTINASGGNDVVHGLTGDDTLSGGGGSDTLIGGLGLDVLTGGSGADTFQFDAGDDGATITDLGDQDALRFASGSVAQTVLGTAQQSGNDTVLTLNGSQITLRNIDDASLARSGSEIVVTDAPSGPSQGNDTYTYRMSDGVVTISANQEDATSGGNDRVVFADLDLSDVEFHYDGGSLQIAWNDGSQSGSLNLASGGEYIERFVFADGSVISGVDADFAARRAINPIAGDERDILFGSNASEQIIGTDVSDYIHGYGGNDILDAGGTSGSWQYLYGYSGNDTYQYGKESGRVFIHTETATSGTADRLVFKDLNLSDVSFSTYEYDTPSFGEALRIQWDDGADSGEVRLSLRGEHIESFEFADGSVISGVDADFAARRAINPIAGDERDILFGSNASEQIIGTDVSDYIHGYGGNDILDAGGTSGSWQYLYGYSGNDTYQYGKESGRVFIHTETATSGTADRLVFKDLNLSDVSFSTYEYDTPSLGEALRILWNDGTDSGEVRLSLGGEHIESFEFADGEVLNYDELIF